MKNKRLIKNITQVMMDITLVVFLGLCIYLICNDGNKSILHDFTSSTDDGWKYVVLYDNYSQFAMINGYSGQDHECVKIPGEINGIPVKVLDGNVFLDHELSKVTIPFQVEELSGPVFLYSKVNEIEFEAGSRLNKIDGIGVLGAEGLDSLYLPDSVEFVSDKAFSYAVDLREMHIGPSVKEIGDAAFYQTKISKITVDEANKWFEVKDGMLIEKHKNRLVTYDHELSTLRIPDYIEAVDPQSIGDSLDFIDVDKNNNTFSSEFGVLYNKDKTSLIRVPNDMKIENFKFSENVENIGRYAFWQSLPDEKIVIPDTVKSLEMYSFLGQDIYITKNLRQADLQTFCGTLFFEGTVSEFENISITNAIPEESRQYDVIYLED